MTNDKQTATAEVLAISEAQPKPKRARKAVPNGTAKAGKAALREAVSKAAIPNGAPPLSRRAQIEADAEAGIVPPAPDFSAATHKRFLRRHAELVALVEAGNLRALRGWTINPVSTSPKALMRYRDLAITALETKAKMAKAAKAKASA